MDTLFYICDVVPKLLFRTLMTRILWVVMISMASFSALAEREFAVPGCKFALKIVQNPQQLNREVLRLYNNGIANISASWAPSEFTNPAQHPAHIQYLVTDTPVTFETINQNPIVEAAVITREKGATRQNWGFILEPDFESVLATESRISNGPIDNLDRFEHNHRVQDVQVLLKETNPRIPNRIILGTAALTGRPLKVIGIYTRVSHFGRYLIDLETVQAIKSLAQQQKLPIANIVSK